MMTHRIEIHSVNSTVSCLGGVMVSMLTIGPKDLRFKPDRGDQFLRVIKIHSMPSFGGEVKWEVRCHKILWHEISVGKYEQKYFRRPNSSFSSPIPPACY
jgi:hypothetical protein